MLAIVRDVSPSVAQCELTHLERTPIDYATAVAQHREYEAALRALGCAIETVPADPAHPDCVFIEDTAVVVDELAVITRPGAESRRGETVAVASALSQHRKLAHLEAPGTLDGGDVLRLDRAFYVGRSARTNDDGIAQLRALVARHGYSVTAVDLHGALHLKTAITQVSSDTLVANRAWIDMTPFAGWTIVDVDEREPFAANALLVGDRVLYPRAFPHTAARLRDHGIALQLVDASELAKAEGGVTCCALLMEGGPLSS